jgi:hypothetical protein
MLGWPLTKAWTAFYVLGLLNMFMTPAGTGEAAVAGLLLGALLSFIATWGLQSVVGWCQRKWAAFRSGDGDDGDDEDGLEDTPDPAD